ncbi:hypothetical protein Tco_0638348 [Tanacetum coccineum]
MILRLLRMLKQVLIQRRQTVEVILRYLQIGEEQGEDVDNQVKLEEKTAELDQGQTGSDPGKTPESRPPPEQVFMDEDQAGPDPGESRVALAGPNPEPTHDEFMANVYPNVHESLKFPADEHVILEDPLSSSGTLSSMKNLDDAYTIRDQFLNEKSTEDEPRKLNVEAEVVSIATVLIYQASSSVPPLSTPVIDLTPPKPVPSTTQAPIGTATTATTATTLPLPPPPQQQSTTDSELVVRVTALEQKFSVFEQKSKTLDNTTQNLGSRVFTLELRDLPHKINQIVNEVVKEDAHVALQAPLRDRFRELPEADMKEILHQRMFESGTYKSLPEHVALYEALEASMERANRDEFFVEKDKSRKRRRDDQDPPPPPPDSDPSKKRRHASDASAPHSKQPVEDVPIPDDVNVLDSEDTDNAHLPKIKTRPDWLKPVLEEDRPATPEPDWVIPPNELPETENNWANALASSYQDPDEYKLLRQTGDMSSFINWFCKQIGKKKLSKADLEGPAFKVVRPFHDNSISLQFQMEECHLLLTDQVDLVNPKGHRVVPDVSKPLPLGGPPGQVTIQTQYFFNKDLEYLVSGDKGRRSALSISKLKAAQYLDFGLKELVPSLWIESERDYDISAAYGISHWWFKRKKFYITRHCAPSDRSKVRSHMRILSVVSLKTFERYGYTFLKEIVLRRADYKEYKISEADFKNLHPNDFKDLYLLHLQGQLNHLSGADKVHLFNVVNLWIRNIVIRKRVEDLHLGIESYQMKLNLTQPDWDASDFLFKEDYTIVSKPRAVIYRDRNDQKKMIYKVGKVRSKCEKNGIVSTEMELELEQTQQGFIHEVSNIRVIPKYHSEDGNPARANIKQALGSFRNSDIKVLLKWPSIKLKELQEQSIQVFQDQERFGKPIYLSLCYDFQYPTIPSEIVQWYDDLCSDDQRTIYKGRRGSSFRNETIIKLEKPKSRSKLAPTTRTWSTCTTLVVPTKRPPPVTNCVLGLAAVTTWQRILNKESRIISSKEDVGGSSNVRSKGKRKML